MESPTSKAREKRPGDEVPHLHSPWDAVPYPPTVFSECHIVDKARWLIHKLQKVAIFCMLAVRFSF